MSEKSKKPAKGSDEPNLELPSFNLGLGRKKKVATEQPAAPQEGATQPETASEASTESQEAAAAEAAMPAAATEAILPTETSAPIAKSDPAASPDVSESAPSSAAPVPDPDAPAPTTSQRPVAPSLRPPSGATPQPSSPPAGQVAPVRKTKRPPAPGSAAARREAAARRQALEAQRAAAQREAAQPEAAQPVPPAADDDTPAETTETRAPDAAGNAEHTAVPLTSAAADAPVARPAAGQPAEAPKRSLSSRVMSSRDDHSRKTRTKPETTPAKTAEENLEIHPRQDTEAIGAKLPRLPGYLAAIVTGALMGLVGVVLAWASAQGCEAVRGVGSCGGFGLFALIVILGIEVLLGAALLKAWRVLDPVSTSFLGVGLVAIIVMLFFLDSIESRWMLLVIPALTSLTYLGSWWVTETLIASDEEELEPADE